MLTKIGVLSDYYRIYSEFAPANDIRYANALALPHDENSVSVIYASHVFEHLDRGEADAFLKESLRLLEPGGTLRLAVPDLRWRVKRYLKHGDGDKLMESIRTCVPKGRGLKALVNAIFIGPRHHLWMYDVNSLVSLLQRAGFGKVRAYPSGEMGIEEPGALDLRERSKESIYVEGRKP